jgi:hypothetical protein
MCLHLRLYYGVDVTMLANQVNKFGQIFPIHRRWKYKDKGNFQPFDFTSKSHLRKIILCHGNSTFFFQTYFRINFLCFILNISRSFGFVPLAKKVLLQKLADPANFVPPQIQ